MRIPLAAVITDIEGTTTPSSFVRTVLFPLARARLPALVETTEPDAELARALAETRRICPGRPPLDTLLHWMDQDAKVTPLKALQARIWRDGFADGSLKGEVYPDVERTLRRWVGAGVKVYCYAAGAVEAQRLLFRHSVAGDLEPLFSGFFDTHVGIRREPESYARLAIALNRPPAELLFLSAVEEDLDAAAVAGWRTCQVIRAADGTTASDRHPGEPDFPSVARRMGLPG
jgi:enolase-phosphatase E1